MKIAKFVGFCVAALLAAGSLSAQNEVPSLQDLVGAKGRDGEYQMEQRGYTWIRTEKTGDNVYSYWQEQENGQCVVVRTTDGRYASIAYAMASSCQGGGDAAGGDEPRYDREDKFDTVCGVMVDGQDYPYRCRAVDFYDGGQKVKTALHYPDQTIRLVWKSGKNVVLHFDGMKPMDATYSTSEGETDFYFEGKTYYYFSDKGRARSEVQNFRD